MRRPLSRFMASVVFSVLTCSAAAQEPANPIGRFEIANFAVEGNTLLGAQAVDNLLAPFIGKNRDFGDVQKALEALEDAYHRLGFNVVQVVLPEQELNQGVVRLKVVETRLGTVRVEGNTFFDQANIRRSLPGLREGEAPNIANVSASLKVANENPAKKTNLQLQSGEQDEQINAVLKVTDDKPWSVGLNLDNSGDKKTGDSHIGVLFQHANVAGLDHVLSLQYTTTLEKPSQVSVYGVGYHIPLYASGDSIDLFTSYSDVDSGTVSAGIIDLQVSGKGSVSGFRYNQNLTRVGNYESKLVYGLDYKAFQNNVALSGIQLGNDVTVHPLSASYIGSWTLALGEAGYYLTAISNLPGGSRGGSDDFKRARGGAPAQYNILRYGANYNRLLPRDWQLRLNLNGQYSQDPLVPGEQFGAGGASSVRGFREREVANDSGYTATLELYSPNLCSGIKLAAGQCRMLGFYDGARATRNKPLPGEPSQASIGSVGLGFRLSMDKYLSLQMDYGQVVDASDTQAKGDRRLHVRLSLSY